MSAQNSLPVLNSEITPAPQSLNNDLPNSFDGDKKEEDAFEDATVEPITSKQRMSNVFAMIAGGAGLMSDGYQNSLLQTGNVIYKKIYGADVYTSQYQTQIANALLVGTILGQFSMGFVVDRIGRKAAMTITTLIIVLGGLLGVVAHAPTAVGFFWFITVARGVVGYGAGGEYPAASTASIEGAEATFTKFRGFFFMMTTTGCIISGQLLTIIVTLIMMAAQKYDDSTDAEGLKKLEITWRVEWSIGVILPLTVLYFRMRLMPSDLYRKSALKRKVPYGLFIKKYWRRLIGTLGTWFLNQFIGYPSGVFSGVIIGNLAPNASTITNIGYVLALATLVIPGTMLGAVGTAYVNRKIQLATGFLGYTVMGLIIGLNYAAVTANVGVFVLLYGIYLTVGAWGPGNLSGLILVESYPTSMRGTAYGWTAAFGKIGGICGTYAFPLVVNSLGVRYTFIIGGCIGALGAIVGWLCLAETRNMKLADQDAEWREYLLAHGWTGTFGDEDPADIEAAAQVMKPQI